MKTRCSGWAPSGILRGSIMQLRTRMLAEMPTLTSRAAITCTIQQPLAGTSQLVLAHQISEALTRPYPTLWHKPLIDYCRLCSWTLARAHARSGDPAEISGYLGRG